MSDVFPLRPNQAAEIELMANAFASVIEGRTAVYLSTPLTSGERWLKSRARLGNVRDESETAYRARHEREVVVPNREKAASLAHCLRGRLDQVVIDPTALADLPGWMQVDYYALWARVIERYVATVVFADGWQYSNGCVYEFLVAVQSDLETLDQRSRPLPLRDGTQLIRSAMQELQAPGLSADFHIAVLRQLT